MIYYFGWLFGYLGCVGLFVGLARFLGVCVYLLFVGLIMCFVLLLFAGLRAILLVDLYFGSYGCFCSGFGFVV